MAGSTDNLDMIALPGPRPVPPLDVVQPIEPMEEDMRILI